MGGFPSYLRLRRTLGLVALLCISSVRSIYRLLKENENLKRQKGELEKRVKHLEEEIANNDKTEGKKETIAEDIRGRTKQLKDLEGMLKLAEEYWPKQTFKKISVTKTGFLAEKDNKILIVDPECKDKRTMNVLEQITRFFPATKEAGNLDEGEIAKTEIVTSSGLVRDEAKEIHHNRKTLLIGRIKPNTTKLSMAETIQKIALRVKQIDDTTKSKIMIHVPFDWDIELMKKLLEMCWTINDAEVEAEISRNKKTPKTEQNKRNKIQQKQKNNLQGTITVGLNDKSYAEVLKNLKEKVNPRDFGVDIRGTKQTAEGIALQVREKRNGGKAKLAQYIEKELHLTAHSRGPRLTSKVLINYIDVLSDTEEILEGLKTALGTKTEEEIRIDNIRKSENSASALISLSKTDANTLIKSGRIKIG